MGKVITSGIVPQLEAPEIKLPDGYTKLVYIEFTGTQYVNTVFQANQNTRLKMKFAYLGGAVVFGAYNAGGNGGFALQAVDGKWLTYYGNSVGASTATISVGAETTVDMNRNILTVDGTVARTATENTFSGDYPILLSCIYDGRNGAGYFTSLKVFDCQIYDNDILVRNYVPCVSPNGEIGLYDVVTKQFYGNAGTGTIIGSEVA